jgi:Icc-related predicted phosphoesterase
MKILSVSDVEIGFIYSPLILERCKDIDVVISCGDLSYFYLEYIESMLNCPLFYVHGNHANEVEYGVAGERRGPWGGTNLNRRVVNQAGLLLAGIEGSLQYNNGPYQYSQSDMWSSVLSLAPALLMNHIRYGRFLDVFVSHAPPWGIHDQADLPHQGIKAFRWLINVFKPSLFLHGHVHVYRSDTPTLTHVGSTLVINTYGFHQTIIEKGVLILPESTGEKKVKEVSHV